jgi:outer membrane protein
MKKLPLILSLVSLLGVVVLLIMNFAGKSNNSGGKSGGSQSGELKIAYLNTDSVLLNYQLAIDLNARFVEQQKQYTDEFGQKRMQLERDAASFQDKVQRGGFLNEERALKERDKILGQEQEIKKMDYELSTRLAGLEQQINKQLVDSIVSYVKEYNKQHKYTYVLSNAGNIIVGEQQYNISKDVLEGLNARYLKTKK